MIPKSNTTGGLLLEMKEISKAFSGIRVLFDVGFDLRRGEVHVIAGENGAGKSTLIKILAGVYDDYTGEIRVSGKRVRFSSPREAALYGITVIYQEMSLIGPMNVVDNIFLGRELGWAGYWVDMQQERSRVEGLLKEIGVSIDPMRPVEEYPVSIRQLIEIAKALAINADIIVMDEPTSSLGELEVERLFTMIRALKARSCGVIYISHKMEEIYRIADRITVLRDGHHIGTAAPEDLPQHELIRWMVGREIGQQFQRRTVARGHARLVVESFQVRQETPPHRMIVQEVSLQAYAGEILGIAGLFGSGSSELLNGIFGVYGKRAEGLITVDDVPARILSPVDALKHGIVLLTNDRKTTGLVPGMTVTHNITLAALRQFSPAGWLRPSEERRAAERQITNLRMKVASIDQEVFTLSGGNQQKVVLAKWMETRPKIFLLDEPTRGVDVGVKYEIYDLMNRWTEEGSAIVLITSEMTELLGMADRIIVMSRGKVTAEFNRGEATQERILQAAMGEVVVAL